MKILGGKFRGRNFYMPAGIRPTQNLVRKAVFDMLGGELEGIEFLELFAGSGAISLESLSRGCEKSTMIEKDPKCAEVIRDNIHLLERSFPDLTAANWDVFNLDAFVSIKMFAEKKRTYDVVFADPPYGRGLAKKTLKTLNAYDILHPNSLLIIEHKKDEMLPESEGRFFLCRQKKYGASFLSVYNLKSHNE